MRTEVAVAAVLILMSGSSLFAQGPRVSDGRFPAQPLTFYVASGRACDNSELRAAESKRNLGKGIAIAGVAAEGLAFLSLTSSSTSITLPLLGAGAVLTTVGLVVAASTNHPAAMNRAASSLEIGKSTTNDVSVCLGRPSSTTTHGRDETWTYSAAKVTAGIPVVGWFIGSGKYEASAVTLSFKQGVLSDVVKTSMGGN